jgi:peptidylprolyl isomerase
MTAKTRALLSSWFVSGLAAASIACGEPPTSTPTKVQPLSEAPAQTTKRSPIEAPKFEPLPGFEGQPVSSTTLPGGLIVEDFVIGTGEEAKLGSEVSLQYYGTLADGTMFDTSLKRNRPFTFTIGQGQVIKGWDQGVPGMKVGGKRRLTVPAELAYGSRKKGKIPPDSQLTFQLELVESYAPIPEPKGDEAFAGEPVAKLELERGLIVEDFVVGDGREAKPNDKIIVHYTGKLDDGTVFDSSLPRKKPLTFVLGSKMVIEGWELGLAGMKVGGLRRLTIPAELAYGDKPKGKIPPNSRLTFTVELMAVRDAPTQLPKPPR